MSAQTVEPAFSDLTTYAFPTSWSYTPSDQEVLNIGGWYRVEENEVPLDKADVWFMQGWVAGGEPSIKTVGDKKITYLPIKRRVFNGKEAIEDVVDAYTKAFNIGRNENIKRYVQIVNLYSSTLSTTVSHLNQIVAGDTALGASVLAIIPMFRSEYATFSAAANASLTAYLSAGTGKITELTGLFDAYNTSVAGGLDDYGDSQRQRINQQFDNNAAMIRQELINRGMNSTIHIASALATNEEKRANALTVLEDSLLDKRVGLLTATYEKNAALHGQIMEILKHLQLHQQGILADLFQRSVAMNQESIKASMLIYQWLHTARLEMIVNRNLVVEKLATFAERREDGYPSLEAMSMAATQLGMADTSGTA